MGRLGRNVDVMFCMTRDFVLIVLIALAAFRQVGGEKSLVTQNKALQGRLLIASTFQSNLSEADILLEFKNGVTDSNGTLAGWNTTRHPIVCQWLGVECDDSGRVSVINLSGMGLQGVISSSLGSLQALSSLLLAHNGFSGEVPSSLGKLPHLKNLDISQNNLTNIPSKFSNWTALTSLNLSGNALTGFIPIDIGNLRSLSQLDLHNNLLTFSIPASIGNCSSLNWLDLSGNQLVGVIPAELGTLGKLTSLQLQINNLTGPIPASLYNLSSLTDLNLQINLLSGEISPDVGLLQNLLSLRLDVNNFTGTIPSSIGNLSSLETLMVGGAALLGGVSFVGPDSWLGGEWLTGRIPAELGKLRNLRLLWLYRTNCTGTLPEELGNLQNLTALYIFHNLLLTPSVVPSSFSNLTNSFVLFLKSNNFHGNIPSWIGSMVNVGFLDLRTNSLTGRLPPEIGNMTGAWRLLLSGNLLSGPIIPELGMLPKLQGLGLDQNWFSGHVPSILGNLSDLQDLYLFQNNLSGTIPPDMVAGMPALSDFFIFNNQISGPIPSEIGKLISLNRLDFSFNQLSGPIPSEIGNCVNLKFFNISHNRISGQLPIDSIEHLRLLQYFIINDNLLEGPVPPNNGMFGNVTVNYGGNAGLCGPPFGKNCSTPGSPPSPAEKCGGLNSGCHRAWIFIISGLGTAVVAVFSCLSLLCWKASKKRRKACPPPQSHGCSEAGEDLPDVSLFIKDLTLTVDDLWAATNGFSQENLLGEGGNSTVYKAMLADQNRRLIAVKCINLNPADRKSATRDLHNELRMLGSLRHRNLVRLYGVCVTPVFKALLLEHVPGGTLQHHLHSGGKRSWQLTLEACFRIAVGMADALVYLHHDAYHQIIHRDLKPSNVLLDSELNPKIADFGISKFVNRNRNGEATASSLFGSTGYIPPEYATSSTVSIKGDIYSYGVILLQMLTGKAPTDNRFGKDGTLVDWVSRAAPDRILDILDDDLKSELVTHELHFHVMVHVGLLCTRSSPKARPSMKDVKQLLSEAKDPETGRGGQKKYLTLQELADQPSAEKPTVQWTPHAQRNPGTKSRLASRDEAHSTKQTSTRE